MKAMSDIVRVKAKVCLLGDSFVGKTSLIRRYVQDEFDDRYISTIGTKVTKKDIQLEQDGRSINNTLMIWDIQGIREGLENTLQQYERFKPQSNFYQSARGAFLVFDVTKRTTLDGLSEWKDTITKVVGDISLLILANKSDLKADTVVDEESLAKKAEELGCGYFFTSAKDGSNVENAFREMAKLLSNVS